MTTEKIAEIIVTVIFKYSISLVIVWLFFLATDIEHNVFIMALFFNLIWNIISARKEDVKNDNIRRKK